MVHPAARGTAALAEAYGRRHPGGRLARLGRVSRPRLGLVERPLLAGMVALIRREPPGT
jgi:hypothetical protein